MALDLAADTMGAGPPVVVLHGLFGSRRNWAGIAKNLARDHTVHVLDLRNHGDSPWDDEMTIPAMAADVGRYVAVRRIAPSALIGHSLGGKVAAWLALTQPEVVARLLVVDVAPVAYDHGFEHFIAAMRAVPVSGLRRRGEADAHLAPAIEEPGIRGFLLQNLVPADGGLRWRLNLDAVAEHMDDITGFSAPPAGAAYAGPTLFLAGGRSDYVRPEHGDVIRRLFPHAEIATIPGAGHWLHADAPEAFLARARAFLGAPD